MLEGGLRIGTLAFGGVELGLHQQGPDIVGRTLQRLVHELPHRGHADAALRRELRLEQQRPHIGRLVGERRIGKLLRALGISLCQRRGRQRHVHLGARPRRVELAIAELAGQLLELALGTQSLGQHRIRLITGSVGIDRLPHLGLGAHGIAGREQRFREQQARLGVVRRLLQGVLELDDRRLVVGLGEVRVRRGDVGGRVVARASRRHRNGECRRNGEAQGSGLEAGHEGSLKWWCRPAT